MEKVGNTARDMPVVKRKQRNTGVRIKDEQLGKLKENKR
jgi:hypothetical protein